jgi:hypothetical protein
MFQYKRNREDRREIAEEVGPPIYCRIEGSNHGQHGREFQNRTAPEPYLKLAAVLQN